MPVAKSVALIATGGTSLSLRGSVTGQVISPSGGPLAFRLAGTPRTPHGYVTVTSDGNFTYAADDGYFGIDQFQYIVNDGRHDSNLGTVTIDPPSMNGVVAANPFTTINWNVNVDYNQQTSAGNTLTLLQIFNLHNQAMLKAGFFYTQHNQSQGDYYATQMNRWTAAIKDARANIGISFTENWNIYMDQYNAACTDFVNGIIDTCNDPQQAIKNSQANTAAALSHLLTVEQALDGKYSASNLAKGASYVTLNLIGVADILQAWTYNVDLVRGELIDPSGGWNTARIVKLSNGISNAALTAAGLKASYNNALRSGFSNVSEVVSNSFRDITKSVQQLSPAVTMAAKLTYQLDFSLLTGSQGVIRVGGSLEEIFKRMAGITAGYDIEVGLVRKGEQFYLVGGDLDSVELGGYDEAIAHTHPSGDLRFSQKDLSSFARDYPQQRQSWLIGPDPDAAPVLLDIPVTP